MITSFHQFLEKKMPSTYDRNTYNSEPKLTKHVDGKKPAHKLLHPRVRFEDDVLETLLKGKEGNELKNNKNAFSPNQKS